MRFLTNTSTDPHFNMAFDEFVLNESGVGDAVFYLWQNRPSVIVGLNQNVYSEVNLPYLESHGIALARRVTGGGAVYHDLGNLNYTIVGRTTALERDCPGYMHLIADALRTLGVDASLSGRNDIMAGGRKVSGYAKRLWKDRMMVHGTLMFDVDLEALSGALSVPGSKFSAAGVASVRSKVANLKEFLPGFKGVWELRDALHGILAKGDGEVTLSAEQLAAVGREAQDKFRTWDWIYGHSPESSLEREPRRLACGSVGAVLSLSHGCIASLRFTGDFLGCLPSEILASSLEGLRYDREILLAQLQKSDVGRFFDGISPADLLEIII